MGGVANTKVVSSLSEVESTAQNIQQVFTGIVTQIQSLDQIVAEIAAASKEQSQGISEVNMAVTQMDKVTQASAANAEENAAASEQLNAQAASMQDLVQQLAILTHGQNRQIQTPAETPLSRAAQSNSAPKSFFKSAPAKDRDEAHQAIGLSAALTNGTGAKPQGEAKVGAFQNF